MALDADGLWAASTTAREMARQNGKGDEIEVVELWGLVQRSERILHTIHDAVLLARETQTRMLGVLEGHKDLRRLIATVHKGIGQQMIELTNGGTIWYRTRTGSGGRGVDRVDRLVCDEWQHGTAEQLAALSPTQFESANPQTNLLGSSAVEGKSVSWWQFRKRALAASPGRFGYVGHTIESLELSEKGKVLASMPADIGDEGLWRSVNPALFRKGEQGVAFLREQRLKLGDELFAQEHLGVWAPLDEADAEVGPIDLAVFRSLARRDSPFKPSTAVLAVDVAYDRSWTSVGAVGVCDDGFEQCRLVGLLPGTAGVAEKVRDEDIKLGRRGVVMAKDEPLADDLEKLGVTVHRLSGADQARASQKFIDACSGVSPSLRHEGEPVLLKALEIAVPKAYGDGNTDFSRKLSPGDVSPLKVLTMAYGMLGAIDAVFAY